MKKLLLLILVLFISCDFSSANTWQNLQQNLVLWYAFEDNESNTTVLDSSGNGYHGVSVRNTEDMRVDGLVNGAFLFNGINDVVNSQQLLQDVFRDEWTIAFWYFNYDIEQEVTRTFYGWTYLYGSDTARIYNKITSGLDLLFSYEAIGKTHTTETIPYGTYIVEGDEWVFYTVTFRIIEQWESYFDFYKNGVHIRTRRSEQDNLPESFDSRATFPIGALRYMDGVLDEYREYYYGLMDNFMLFNKALSQEEVSFLYVKATKLNGYVLIKR